MFNLSTRFLLFLMIIFSTSFIKGQEASSMEEAELYSESEIVVEPIFSTPPSIALLASTTVRFDNTASAYLKWKAIDDVSNYRVSYRLKDQGGRWQSEISATNEVVINNLLLDAAYEWSISVELGNRMYGSIEGSFETVPQSEPIALSAFFYKAFTDWTNADGKGVLFCDFLEQLDIHPFEKLAFLQVYSFKNEPLVYGGNSRNLSDWYPKAYQGFNCLGYDTTKDLKENCGCKVVTRALNNARPGWQENDVVKPTEDIFIAYEPGNNKTYVDLIQGGAAKFVSLRQENRAGSLRFEMGNMQSNGAARGTTTAASEIMFYLACLRADGSTDSAELPARCLCNRNLEIRYQYTSSMWVKSVKKRSIWSKGGAAEAEDVAFVTAYDERSGRITPLAYGEAMIGRQFNQAWNPDWWRSFTRLGLDAYAFYQSVSGEGSDQEIDTTLVNQLSESLIEIGSTSFADKRGIEGDTLADVVLVSGFDILELRPNRPVRVTLFSSYFVEARGHNTFHNESSIASDYFLMGVARSEQQTEDPECCSDKTATYIVGSLSTPVGGDVENYAVNDISGRLEDVGFFLGSYGAWDNLPTDPRSGQIRLGYEYDILFGRSCEDDKPPRINGENIIDNDTKKIHQLSNSFVAYPSVTRNIISIRLQEDIGTDSHLFLRDAYGRVLLSKNLSEHNLSGTFQLNLGDFSAGIYWLTIIDDKNQHSQQIIKQ